MLTQRVESYERDVELVDFVCACPNCTYCSNLPITGYPTRKYCCADALLEARRKQRAQQAIAEGRIPGRVGRPPKNIPENILYVLHMPETDFYLVGWSENQSVYKTDFETYQRSLPDRIEEQWVFERPASATLIEAIYARFANRVVNGQWLKFEGDSIEDLRSTLEPTEE